MALVDDLDAALTQMQTARPDDKALAEKITSWRIRLNYGKFLIENKESAGKGFVEILSQNIEAYKAGSI